LELAVLDYKFAMPEAISIKGKRRGVGLQQISRGIIGINDAEIRQLDVA